MLRHDFARPDGRAVPAPTPEALDLQARIRRRGIRLADLSTVADRRALLNGLARGALTVNRYGDALVIRGGAR